MFVVVLCIAAMPAEALPPGTYDGYWEPFQGEEPPTEDWYTFTAPAGTWSTDTGRLLIGAGGGNGAIFTMTAALAGSWEITTVMDNFVNDQWPFVPNCDAAGDGSLGASVLPRGAAAVTLFQMRVLLNCGTGAITQDFPSGMPVDCNVASDFGTFTFSWDTATDTFTVDGPGGVCAMTPTTAAATMDGLASIRFPQGVQNDVLFSIYDDLILNRFDGTTFVVQESGPEPPNGLSALVIQAHSGFSSLTEMRWNLAPNDPDPVAGSFEYEVYLSGTLVATDTITSQDGDGVRFHLVDYSAGEPVSFWIRAFNATSGERSLASCAVSVDTRVQNDFDSCGVSVGAGPGGIGGTTEHTTPTDTAAGLLGFCSDLMGDSDGSLFLCGMIFVVFAFLATAGGFAAITGTAGMGPTIAGATAGFGVMIFNVFAGIWGLVWAIVLIILVAAIIAAIMKKFVGAGGAPSGQ